MEEAKRIIKNAGFNTTTIWSELEGILNEQIEKAKSIPDLIVISDCLVNAIGQKQSNLMKKIRENKELRDENKNVFEQNKTLERENFKLKELIGLEQFKNKCLLDKFGYITNKKYQVIIEEIKN